MTAQGLWRVSVGLAVKKLGHRRRTQAILRNLVMRICLLIVLVAVNGLVASYGQEKKRRGFFERLNEKIDKLNQKTADTPPPPAGNEQVNPEAASRTLTKRMPCTVQPWEHTNAPDAALSLPHTYVKQYEGDYPVAPESPRTYSIEEFGQTRTMRVVFPQRRYRTLYKLNGKQEIVEPRDPVAPFEYIFTLDGGVLKVGICDEKGVFYESLHVTTQPSGQIQYSTTRSLQLVSFSPRQTACPRCYFVNKVFHSGTETKKYVILVNPDLADTPYYIFEVPPWEEQFSFGPTGNLCQIRRSDRSMCGEGKFEHIEVSQEPADGILFPNTMTSRWYLRCAADRCEQRSFGDIVRR